MAGNSIGELFRITTFGESHGLAVGVVIDGCPPGIPLSEDDVQAELDRRKPGQSVVTTERQEEDKALLISGVFEGKTTGTPICILINNRDSDPGRYEAIKDVFRPGHADYTYHLKYGHRDYRGGGRSSGRETAARVAAGAVAKKVIGNAEIIAYTLQVGNIQAKKFIYPTIETNSMRCPDMDAAKKMEELVLKVKKKGDSIGGSIECIARNVPVGVGEPVFDKLNADLAKAVMSIGGIKGIEFGAGFSVVKKKGSENNDALVSRAGGAVFSSNNQGGILGGISTGQDIVFRVAVKPTSSIAKEQKTVTKDLVEAYVKVEGRHDPCLCPRMVPVVEAMTAITLADHMLRYKAVR